MLVRQYLLVSLLAISPLDLLTSESDIQFHFRSAESALLPSGEGQLCHHLSHGNGKVWPVHRLLAGEEKLIIKPSLSLIKSLFTLTSCSVSAAAGGLSRHTRDRMECGQLGTGEGENISKMKKMYKRFFISQRTFYSSESSLGVLQLAPSIDHQISAMFSILERYPEIFN